LKVEIPKGTPFGAGLGRRKAQTPDELLSTLLLTMDGLL